MSTRVQAGPFDYGVPEWRPYNPDRLADLEAPAAAVAALTGRGLPDGTLDHFVRVPDRELTAAELPECGRVAFLGQVWDGYNNTYWLNLTDGAVWMRYGPHDGPVHHMKRINTSVRTLQSILTVYLAYESGSMEIDDREDLINQAVIHAVAADPEMFEDDENWWSQTFLEVEFGSAKILLGDRSLFQLANLDEAGRWGLDHPGYEEGW